MSASDPQNTFEVTLAPLPKQTVRFIFHPVCPGSITVDITLSPLKTTSSTRTAAHVFATVPAITLGDPSTPAYVSRAVSPISVQEPSTPAHVSRAVSPIPLSLMHLLPPDLSFSITDLLDSQEELDIPNTSTPLLSPWVIVSDLELETDKRCGKCGGRRPGSPEIISETEPESD